MNDDTAARFDPRHKLALHPQFADHLAGRKVYPVGLEISPSGACTANCRFCFYANTGELGGHRKVFLKKARALRLLLECAGLGLKAVTWTGGGEPTLHPDFPALAEAAYACGLEQGLFTNALSRPRYEPQVFSWVRVTMTDRPYRQECIEPLRAAKALGFAFNYAGPQDLPYLEDTLALAEVVGADYVQVRPALPFHGKTADIEPPPLEHPLLHVTGYKFAEAKKPHGYARCEGYHFVPFLWEDGNLDVCAYNRKYEGYTLGNVYRESLKDILDRAPASVPVHDRCQVCCKNHEINLAVHAARGLKDVNFP